MVGINEKKYKIIYEIFETGEKERRHGIEFNENMIFNKIITDLNKTIEDLLLNCEDYEDRKRDGVEFFESVEWMHLRTDMEEIYIKDLKEWLLILTNNR